MESSVINMDVVTTKTVLATIIPESTSAFSTVEQCASEYEYELIRFEKMDALFSEKQTIHPDVILCHQELLESEGMNCLDDIVKAFPDAKVLLIGPECSLSRQIEALKHGARGYVNQTLSPEKLDCALNVVLHGEVWVGRDMISGLIDELQANTPEISKEQQQALATLSPKELEVAKRVSHGATNKMIARSMNITERTVKAHLTTIFQKMQLPDRLSLAIFFRDLRL